MINKLSLDSDLNETIEKLNELIESFNTGNSKHSCDVSVESWYKANEKRIIEILKEKPVPGVILNLMQRDNADLYCSMSEHAKTALIKRIAIKIDELELITPVKTNGGKLLNEMQIKHCKEIEVK
jgi:hypothetical protein